MSLRLAAAAALVASSLGARDFTLRTVDGAAVPFSSLRGGVTAVVFVSTQCPISNGYNDRMNALVRDYAGRVRFVFVNANANESAAEVAAHVKSHGLEFTPYRDPEGAAADRFGASVTPEAFVLAADGRVVYRGAIDDAANPARVKARALRAALDAVLAGGAPPQAELKAFGCTIKRKRP